MLSFDIDQRTEKSNFGIKKKENPHFNQLEIFHFLKFFVLFFQTLVRLAWAGPLLRITRRIDPVDAWFSGNVLSFEMIRLQHPLFRLFITRRNLLTRRKL